MPRAGFLLGLFFIAACNRGNKPPPLTAPDPYEDYTIEEHSLTAPPELSAGEEVVYKGRLYRFDLARGSTRNGAGFAVLARRTPDGGRVVAMEFDGVLQLGDQQHEASGFGGVALVAFDPAGKLAWSRFLGGGSYHYVKALEVAASGDIVVGGAFGERGLALMSFSPQGEERWRLEPASEPPWSEVSSLAVDGDGNVVMVGIFQSRLDLPGTPALRGRYFDGFVAKVDGNSGQVAWVQQLSSPEVKVEGVYVTESGDVIAVGDFKRQLRAGNQSVRGRRDFFVARLSAQGTPELLARVSLGWAGRVQTVQPLAGERLAVLVKGDGSRSALVGVSETDGEVVWTVEDRAPGAALGTDERRRPQSVLYGTHDAEPSYGSGSLRVRDIGADGATRESWFIDSGPYLFVTDGELRRLAGGGLFMSGSLRDQHWDNDGFYPFLLDAFEIESLVNLTEMVAIGGGTGTRCREALPAKLVWKDVRVAVSYRLGELSACGADLQNTGARFELEPDGTVAGVRLEGKLKGEQTACLAEVLRTLRICPFEGGPRTQRLGRLK